MKAAVVGANRIALEHLHALKTLGPLEVFVCDQSAAAAEYAAERFDLAGWYVDFQEMMHRARPEVAHVTTPAGSDRPPPPRGGAIGRYRVFEYSAGYSNIRIKAVDGVPNRVDNTAVHRNRSG